MPRHNNLSQDGSLFFVRVKSGQSGTWSLAKSVLVKIPSSGTWELADNLGVNLGLDWPPPARGFQISRYTHTHTRSLRLPTTSRIILYLNLEAHIFHYYLSYSPLKTLHGKLKLSTKTFSENKLKRKWSWKETMSAYRIAFFCMFKSCLLVI